MVHFVLYTLNYQRAQHFFYIMFISIDSSSGLQAVQKVVFTFFLGIEKHALDKMIQLHMKTAFRTSTTFTFYLTNLLNTTIFYSVHLHHNHLMTSCYGWIYGMNNGKNVFVFVSLVVVNHLKFLSSSFQRADVTGNLIKYLIYCLSINLLIRFG